MNKVFIDLKRYQKEIEIRKKTGDYSLGGKTGFCFIEGKYIIKIYNYPIREKNYLDFSSYTSNRISFPINYIFSNGYVIGEIMPYYKADTIDNTLNLKTNINFLYESYTEIIKEIKKFPNIAMYDLWQKNVLFSNKTGFYLIDITDWKYINSNHVDSNIGYLDRTIGYMLNELVFNDGNLLLDINNSYRILHGNNIGREILSIYLGYIKREYKVLEFIDAYEKFIKINYNYDIKTLSDMKKYTKIMKYS